MRRLARVVLVASVVLAAPVSGSARGARVVLHNATDEELLLVDRYLVHGAWEASSLPPARLSAGATAEWSAESGLGGASEGAARYRLATGSVVVVRWSNPLVGAASWDGTRAPPGYALDENTAESSGTATADLTLRRVGPKHSGPSRADLDLVWTAVDRNGFPRNPAWAYQWTHPGRYPDPPSLCSAHYGDSCSTQAPDWEHAGGLALGCRGDGAHVVWMPVTVEGPLYWSGWDRWDDDDSLWIVSAGGAALTADMFNPAEEPSLKVAFKEAETVDQFATAYWTELRKAIHGEGKRGPAELVDGHRAVVTGLLGLDAAHGARTELVPVYALAVEAHGDGAGDDAWAYFLRTSGATGGCGAVQHAPGFPDGRFVVRIPWQPGATSVRVIAHERHTTDGRAVAWEGYEVARGDGVYLRFLVKAPSMRASIDGLVTLRWTRTAPVVKATSMMASR